VFIVSIYPSIRPAVKNLFFDHTTPLSTHCPPIHTLLEGLRTLSCGLSIKSTTVDTSNTTNTIHLSREIIGQVKPNHNGSISNKSIRLSHNGSNT
jgi:hypothetical protein